MHSSFFGMPQRSAKDYQEYHELLNLDKPVTIEFDVDFAMGSTFHASLLLVTWALCNQPRDA